MKATINGITVEGTSMEIYELIAEFSKDNEKLDELDVLRGKNVYHDPFKTSNNYV